MEVCRDIAQAFVVCPEARIVGKRSRDKEVGVNVTDASPHQATSLDESDHLVMFSNNRLRQFRERIEDIIAALKIS